MNLRLFFKEAFAIAVYDMLKTQAESMKQKYSKDGDLLLDVDLRENLQSNYYDSNWRLYDGFLFKVEVRVWLERYDKLGIDYINDTYPNPGLIPVKIWPVGAAQERTTVVVEIGWHPSEDIPETRPYFMELMEPWEEAWGGVMRSLVDQAPILAFYNTCEPRWDFTTEDWHYWFGYYEAVQGKANKLTLPQMAVRLGCSEDKVKKYRRRWLKEWQNKRMQLRSTSS